ADALRVAALAAAETEDYSNATASLEEALGLARSISSPYVEARVRAAASRAAASRVAMRRQALTRAAQERGVAVELFTELRHHVLTLG
ncbi:MAG: hypothetical protein ACRDQ1_08950, partial [Sciscionella sp.]